MSWLRNALLDWKDMCSADNTTSKGFYRVVTAIYAVIVLGSIAVFITLALGIVPATFKTFAILGPIVALAAVIGSFIFLATRK